MRTPPYPGIDPAGPSAGVAATTQRPAPVHPLTDLPLSPHATFRRLRMSGFTSREAGTLVAHLVGLRGRRTGWAIEEVEHLLFVRALVDTDRMGS